MKENDVSDGAGKHDNLSGDRLSQIALELREKIDAVMNERFERDRAFINDTVGRSMKFLGWAIGFVALIFTLFGIKTFADVTAAARNAATKEVTRQLSIDDPNSPFNRDVKRLLSRAVIDSYLLTLAQKRNQRFGIESLDVPETDASRLIDLVKDPHTNERDFQDALEILFRISDNRIADEVRKTIAEMGLVQDETFKWIDRQPAKRAAIFDKYPHHDLQPAARTILADGKMPETLLIAAIRYSSRTTDAGALPDLERLVKQGNSSMQLAALSAVARIRPRSPVISAWLVQLNEPNLGSRRWVDAMSVVASLLKQKGGPFEDDPDAEYRSELGGRIMQKAFSSGMYFQINEMLDRESLAIAFRNEPNTSYTVPASLIFGEGRDVISNLMSKAARSNDMNSFRDLVQAVCLAREYECSVVVRTTLSNNGGLLLESGQTLDAGAVVNGAGIRTMRPSTSQKLDVVWFDPAGNKRIAQLSGFRAPQSLSFTISTEVQISESEEDY